MAPSQSAGAVVNRFSSVKFLVAATVATAGLVGTTAAVARPDVTVSIGFQSRPVWVEPEPVYVQPRPIYVQPRPVYVPPRPVVVRPAPLYVEPPIYVLPGDAYERPRWGGHDARSEWEQERAWRRAEWRRNEWRRDGWREHHGHSKHDRHDRKWHHGRWD
jgi:hypothetical protein